MQAAVLAYLDFLEMNRWIHRRVDTITYPAAERGRRDVSVDLDLGHRSGGITYEQLILVAKDQPGVEHSVVPNLEDSETADIDHRNRLLVVPIEVAPNTVLSSFDLRDHSGDRVPVATKEHNQAWVKAVLQGAAVVAGLSREGLAGLDAKLDAIVTHGDDQGTDPLDERSDRQMAADADRRNAVLKALDGAPWTVRWLATIFVSNFPILALLPEAGARRRVVKYGAEFDQDTPPARWRDELLARPYVVEYNLADPGLQRSYHVELHVPEGLEPFSAGLYRRDRPKGPPVPARRRLAPHLIHITAAPSDLDDVTLRVGYVASRQLLWTALAVAFVVSGVAIGATAGSFGGEAGTDHVWNPTLLATGALGLLAYHDRPRAARAATRRMRYACMGAVAALVAYLLAATAGVGGGAAWFDGLRFVPIVVGAWAAFLAAAHGARRWLRRLRRNLFEKTRPRGAEV